MTRPTLPEPLLMQVYCLMMAASVGLSVAILTSTVLDERALGDGGARNLVDWVPLVSPEVLWGLLFLVVGVGMVAGIRKPWTVHLLRFALVVYAFLAISFAISDAPTGLSLMATVLALGFAAINLIVSVRIDVYGWR